MQANTTVNFLTNRFFSRWPRYFAVAACIFVAVFVYWESVILFSLLSALFFISFIYHGRVFWKDLGIAGGTANHITAARVVGILLLLFFQASLPPLAFFVLGILILIADGLDGYFARKYNTVSEFGDFFDKETDAFFVLAFCIILMEKGLAGPWVLIPGLMRYAFVLILFFFNIENISLSKSYRRRFIGMWFMGTIMACFVLPQAIYTAGMLFATTMLAYSFMKDIYLMLRKKYDQG